MTPAYWVFCRRTHYQPNLTTMQINKRDALFVGIDVHKDTHTAVGLDPFGEKVFELRIGNHESDFLALAQRVEQAKGVLSPYIGLEDCRGYGERLAGYLVERYPVVHVPSIRVERERRSATHPEKSDALDAYGVAKIMMTDDGTLSSYAPTAEAQKAKQLQELSLDREYSSKERTRLKNQLHVLLHRIWNTDYQAKFKDPFSLKALRYWAKARPACDDFLVRAMKRKVRRLMQLHDEIAELEAEADSLLRQGGYTIQTASGCGTVLAATMIGEIGDISRFRSPAALAKYAGCSPRECSSGKRIRHRRSSAGNRRLNCAFHRMALSQISRMGNERARLYFARKVSEGKSKAQALVCLRRQMVNVIWMMMKYRTEYRYPQA